MNRSFLWIRILLGVGLALAGLASFQEATAACGACARHAPLPIALLGLGGYGALLGAALLAGPSAFVFTGIAVAASVHGALVGHMVSTGAYCGLCLLAAANAAALLVLAFVGDPDFAGRFALAFPATAVAMTVILSAVSALRSVEREETIKAFIAADPPSTQATVPVARITVVEKSGCRYCEDLRTEVIPRLAAEFGASIEVAYLDLAAAPGVTRTPTIRVAPRGEFPGELYEGLPPYWMIRDAVARAVAGSAR